MKSDARTVQEYLEELPDDRRAAISKVREVVRAHLPDGYEETMNWGMISWEIPLSRYPDTYNKRPLGYAALAAQKNYNTLYLMSAYTDSESERRLRDGFSKAGKKLDMGKCCIHFRKVEDLELDAIADVVASTPPDRMIQIYENARRG